MAVMMNGIKPNLTGRPQQANPFEMIMELNARMAALENTFKELMEQIQYVVNRLPGEKKFNE